MIGEAGPYAKSVGKGGEALPEQWSCRGLKKGRKNASHETSGTHH